MQKFKITAGVDFEAFARTEKAAYTRAHVLLKAGNDVKVWWLAEDGVYRPYEDLSAADFTD